MYSYLRKALFALDPELAHTLSLDAIGAAERLRLVSLFNKPVADDPVELMGLTLPNPVGLAAGLDKNAQAFNGLGALGFGFIEVGTVTPRPQPGNPQPRLFRIEEAEAIVNRMGFNNLGVEYLVQRVMRRRYGGVLGINVGKNFDTPVERAADDYCVCMDKVYAHADYITANVSSPNTKGLRNLQFGDSLNRLLGAIKEKQQRLAQQHDRYVPLAVKIAPDIENDDIEQIAAALREFEIDGVIATNTTIDKSSVAHLPHGREEGGLSGKPLRDKSTEVIARLAKALRGELPIIGVGGIFDGESAAEKIRAGATAVQIYTGFIYRGPAVIREAVEAIALLRRQSAD
ncbi:quinone-dependent dihydroorotate dehydrogenase [Microbulbifer thermotolerans]|uniref:Dihydroorotate dehydrogenase (quinone) n=1 Tax=Microbulbifer thermotolerans TaxID=252514 RepID=A0AB35HTY9_MICTH|nr:quinone-dependent dihydroorotate dehydrogenase [Microbulbifer thermotolerans]MCX2779810.1 quinone-dependent dihydroorotate dehydrogenase [Microbulbifer thermotolerans]MCX2800411.1 quinone-dependent dihydroorotate dehydrogenase [Microbulbifer thermotolerans]MCX2805018.1 quinone-dependent dihydroorotate dehydrogenase [Microbulbifer thermotolerans]MCX2832809.1 quinone-dependent dihydroorotate dehydrogenase [Microbulbifer thermotolerans]MCX2833519.1 quinone-dependent dihydroorotate dehydrogenas